MATLSFRLPASRQDGPLRHASWSRGSTPVKVLPKQPARRPGLPMVTEVIELQSPTGLSIIELPASPVAAPAVDDGVSPGWFDSTWDLQQGLEISEGLPSDLPLDCWLQAYLAPSAV